MSTTNAGPASIRGQLQQLIGDRRSPIELRCIQNGQCRAGLFDDLERLAEEAWQANEAGANCYFNLNRIQVEQARVKNCLGPDAINATEIDRVESILIDIDPVRASNTASTDEEKKAALQLLGTLLAWLGKLGWAQPVVVDSGNGYHAIFAIELEISQAHLVKSLLQLLAQKFNNEQATVDETVADPCRVPRLPGTFNRKGAGTLERPHRMAQACSSRARGTPVTLEQIQDTIRALATDGMSPGQTTPTADDIEEARQWLTAQRVSDRAMSNDKLVCKLAATLVIDFALLMQQAVLLLKEFRKSRTTTWTDQKIDEVCVWACTQIPISKDRFGRKQGLSGTDDPDIKKNDADRLVDLVLLTHRLSYTRENETYASVPLATGGVLNLPTTSDDYGYRLLAIYYEAFGKIPSATTVATAAGTLSGLARINGEPRETNLRIAAKDGVFYVDVGDAEWNCIAIDKNGWRIIVDPPVMFRRSAGFERLPTPIKNGNFGPLAEFLNVGSGKDLILLLGFLLVGFNPRSEYPVLLLYGEQGTSKSTTATVLRALCDPNKAPLRNNPRNDDDFAVAGYNNHVVVFDNLSYIDGKLSDNLCRMSGGATLSKRQHYTDRDEVLVSYKNLVILNGITELAQRADLLNRAIAIDLPKIQKRRSSGEFWEAFAAAAPGILGGLLNAVAYALANPIESDVELPRMAEFCRFVMSAEPELARQWNEYIAASGRLDASEWDVDDFYQAYLDNIDQCSLTAAEQVPFLRYLDRMLQQSSGWSVRLPATELLNKLRNMAANEGDATNKGTGWPQSGTAMGTMLQRLVPTFRELGIIAVRERKSGGNRERTWVIEKKPVELLPKEIGPTPPSQEA